MSSASYWWIESENPFAGEWGPPGTEPFVRLWVGTAASGLPAGETRRGIEDHTNESVVIKADVVRSPEDIADYVGDEGPEGDDEDAVFPSMGKFDSYADVVAFLRRQCEWFVLVPREDNEPVVIHGSPMRLLLEFARANGSCEGEWEDSLHEVLWSAADAAEKVYLRGLPAHPVERLSSEAQRRHYER